MHIRLTDRLLLLTMMVVGGILPLGTFSGDVGRLVITFLGLISASILPTISLILGNMTTNGRSVKAIDELHIELQAAMDNLFLLFGLVGISVVILLSLSITTPVFIDRIKYCSEIMERIGQAFLATSSTLIILRVGIIPGILRRSLAIRHKIAVEEARRRTIEKSPDLGATKSSFSTHADFAKTVSLDDLKAQDPH